MCPCLTITDILFGRGVVPLHEGGCSHGCVVGGMCAVEALPPSVSLLLACWCSLLADCCFGVPGLLQHADQA